jgi:putative sugar O-methyltransferase
LDLKSKTRFLEIGAGSGRTALSLLKLIVDSKYIIVDIPPALYISQENIIQNIPHKRIFKFQNFTNLEEVKDEFNKADIIFLSPEQIKLIPDKYVDVAIAIDCLHEMISSDVEKYFKQFNRIATYLYFKCQNVQWAKTSKILLTIDSYPVRSHWEKIMHEKCYVPNDYFQAIYRM